MNKSSLKAVYIICILIFGFAPSSDAQRWKLRRYEVGGGLGVAQVFGDIGGTIDQKNWFGLKDIKFSETNLAVPLYVRYKLDPFYSVKVNTALAFGQGDDENSRNDRGRSYKTMLVEFSGQFEYYFIPEERRYRSAAMFDRRGMLNNYMSFSAYAFLGVGGVYSHANVTFTQDIYPVDKIKNNSVGVVFPLGLGLKYIIDDRWLIVGELGYRFSVTDYIEGYKQDQDSKFPDVYYFLSLSVGYKLSTSRSGIPSFFEKEYRMTRKRKPAGRNQPRSKREALE
jgi:hypothetical protein